jgi:hypothetical protein
MDDLVEYALENDGQRRRIRELLVLLRKSHDLMDDYNVQHDPQQKVPRCLWCHTQGVDIFGQMHTTDCILVQIRLATQ